MDWSKTKTIFIIVFLILNMFLLYQYVEKKDSSDYDYLTESTIEDSLKENGITYKTLPKQTNKEQYLSAKSKDFSDDDLKKLKNQDATRLSPQKIYSKLDKPFQLEEKIHSEALDNFVKENVLYGDRYRFWKVDGSTIIYYQTYNEKMIYNNDSAKLVLSINDNQVQSYEQTYLEDIDKQANEQEDVVKAINAIEALFYKDHIPSNSEITDVELGYINLIQYASASHILTPTWHVEVDKKEDLFVNALDGRVIEFEEEPDVSEEMNKNGNGSEQIILE
ncbi:two-component system regulatory protein YycI [Bacillus sp. JJ722]|uniref:two-component system regulatory protein YycI n=1 Tax=Bacillus sp. JJ722 TaxID=3122973 RepID=UPI003000F42F